MLQLCCIHRLLPSEPWLLAFLKTALLRFDNEYLLKLCYMQAGEQAIEAAAETLGVKKREEKESTDAEPVERNA